MKPIGGARSKFSRISRAMFWCSLILMVATLVYWPIARSSRVSFRSLGGNDRFPTAAVVIGNREFAWLVDSQELLLWYVHDPGGQTLPLVKPYGPIGALFNKVALSPSTDQSRLSLVVFKVITFHATAQATGTPLTIRIMLAPFERLVTLFAVWPTMIAIRAGWRAMPDILRARRIRRARQLRNSLGNCTCGYDLRMSRSRCPECGRAFRRVPVSLPARPKRRKLMKV